MASEWKRTSLSEAGVSLIDCDHRTPPAADTGYPYVAIPQLKQGRLSLADVRRISPEHFVDWTRKAKPQHHDVILSRRYNPGETAYVPAGLETSPRCFAGIKSRTIITTAFQKTRFNMSLTDSEQAPVPEAWFAQGCYQIANRLAALNFLLHEINTAAHLAFVYFTGDAFAGRSCPRSEDEWLPLLDRTYAAMELPHQHCFSQRVHRLFVDVATVNN